MIDPRKATTWTSLGVNSSLSHVLPGPKPTMVQRKMLALNQSMVVRANPRSGKTTAAMLKLAANPASSLVLVPTRNLVEYYVSHLSRFGLNCCGLFRSGSIESDEEQHNSYMKLIREEQNGLNGVLVTTPTRLLDYLSWKEGVHSFDKLQQVVIDEIDEFPSRIDQQDKPLGKLLRYVYSQVRQQPVTTMLGNYNSQSEKPVTFKDLIQIQETPQQWPGITRLYDSRGKRLAGFQTDALQSQGAHVQKLSEDQLANTLKKIWQGPGVVVIPRALSPIRFGEALKANSLTGVEVYKEPELAGIPIRQSVGSMYVMGIEQPTDINRLQWTLGDTKDKTIHIVLAPY